MAQDWVDDEDAAPGVIDQMARSANRQIAPDPAGSMRRVRIGSTTSSGS